MRIIQDAEIYKAEEQKYQKKVQAIDASQQTETEVFVDHLNEVKSLIELIMRIN